MSNTQVSEVMSPLVQKEETFLSSYYVLSPFICVISLILTAPQGRYYLYIEVDKTKVQRGKVVCPKSHSQGAAKIGFQMQDAV